MRSNICFHRSRQYSVTCSLNLFLLERSSILLPLGIQAHRADVKVFLYFNKISSVSCCPGERYDVRFEVVSLSVQFLVLQVKVFSTYFRFLVFYRILCVFLLAFSILGCRPSSRSDPIVPVTDELLQDAGQDNSSWLTYGRTYQEQRYSPLDQISEESVKRLGLAWSKELGTRRGLEATPLVWKGVMYFTSTWSVVHAVDALTGETLWWYDPQVSRSHARVACCDVVNRGVALYGDKVFVGTIDGRLLALDMSDGQLVWETLTVDLSKPYTITGAPRAFKGKVLIGNGGAEFGVRGYVSAYDTETGDLLWRTYTVPGDPSLGFESERLEKAAETWNGEWWVAGGGGTVWDSIVYDPELDLVYIGTGNGSPWSRDLRSPGGGDNLFLSSIIALKPDDGIVNWYYQTTPGDNWDYTATQPIMLADLQIEGRTRKVLMQAPKNGFFYVLDRQTGELISAENIAPITWAIGVDTQTGRPIENPNARSSTQEVLVVPGPEGVHNWHSMSYNPDTGLVYIPAKEGYASIYAFDKRWKLTPLTRNNGVDWRYDGPMREELAKLPPPIGMLIAWDPVKQREVWRSEHPVREGGGTLTTAGNLVFQGRSDGKFLAFRATDGEVLWEMDAQTGIMAAPVTYELDGKQYISVLAGWGGPMGLINPPGIGPVKPGWGRLLTFALNGLAEVKTVPFGHSEPPTPAIEMDASSEDIVEGRWLFHQHCRPCHGVNAIAATLPDLRYSTAEVHQQFEAIVFEGAREPLGMPSFEPLLTREQIKMIQAYVLAQAKAASEN